MIQNISNHWNEYYDKGADFGLIPAQSLTKILSFVDENIEKTNLDIGCGTGQLTRELNHRGWRCVGVDSAARAIETARSSTIRRDEVRYQQFDIEQDDISTLPLQPYSLITCKLVYAFIQDKPQFLERVDSLLAPGGTFAIITPVYQDEADARPIAVDAQRTADELQLYFQLEAHYEGVGVMYFIVKKR